jgi:hypothetical protein
MKKVVFYTCYFGGDNNHSKLIGKLPSATHDCVYFTNNLDIYKKLENTGWKRIWVDNIPIYDCHIKDTQSSKLLRCCPHKFDILSNYEYTCWIDSKLDVFEDKVMSVINLLDNSDKCMALTKHPYSDRFTSVWDEYNIALGYQKYFSQKEQYFNYITKKINEGFSDKLDIHYAMGFNLRKKCIDSEKIGEVWYSHILECGIEDQISFQFVKQLFSNLILTLNYQQTWKYSYQ